MTPKLFKLLGMIVIVLFALISRTFAAAEKVVIVNPVVGVRLGFTKPFIVTVKVSLDV